MGGYSNMHHLVIGLVIQVSPLITAWPYAMVSCGSSQLQFS